MTEFKKYPSTNQFRHMMGNVARRHNYKYGELPTLKFKGTVKIHGTNAAVGMSQDGSIYYQSRNRIITPEDDNYGFAAWASAKGERYWQDRISNTVGDSSGILYGEWFGEGISPKVALATAPKSFAVFAVKSGDEWQRFFGNVNNPNEGVYDVHFFGVWYLNFNFNNLRAEKLEMDAITEEIDAKCPVGEYFNLSGHGEGVVWQCVEDGYFNEDFRFKHKGRSHRVTRTEKLAKANDPEREAKVQGFVAATTTGERLRQGIEYLREMGLPLNETSTGHYIKWVVGDIQKEDSDTLETQGLKWKHVNSFIGRKARTFYFNALENAATAPNDNA